MKSGTPCPARSCGPRPAARGRRDALPVEDVFRGDKGDALLRDVARDADEATFSESEGELAARPARRCASRRISRPRPIEVRDLPVLRDFLRDEANELEAVLFRVSIVAFIKSRTRTRDTGAEGRMHSLDRRRGCPRRRGRSRRAPLPSSPWRPKISRSATMENFFSCIAVSKLCWLSMRGRDLVHKEDALWDLWIAPDSTLRGPASRGRRSGKDRAFTSPRGRRRAPVASNEGWAFHPRMVTRASGPSVLLTVAGISRRDVNDAATRCRRG